MHTYTAGSLDTGQAKSMARTATIRRDTQETRIGLTLDLDAPS